jgi:hypothetical protein
MKRVSTVLLALLIITQSNSFVIAAENADFSGDWESTYGSLTMKQTGNRVTGSYDMHDNPCLIEGSVQGNRLTFTYREPNAAGEGWFDLSAKGASFDGRWREEGKTEWGRWTGERIAKQPTQGPSLFNGIWNSTYGPLRLRQDGNTVRGFYRMKDGRFADITGTANGRELSFSYNEGNTKGTGQFTMNAQGSQFTGTWKAEDGMHGDWTGARIAAKPGRTWLIVLEARWEESLDEREYAYGTMLEAFFARAPNVECRHRFFDDADSLKRVCSEIPFLPEPVVVVIASHGAKDGVVVGNRRIDAATIAECFARANNVSLLHFSSCLVMEGSMPTDLAKRLPSGISFPMSGYTTAVDWGASAAVEFLYLDFILARGMEPADAAKSLLDIMPVAGDHTVALSPFEPLGLRFIPARKLASTK